MASIYDENSNTLYEWSLQQHHSAQPQAPVSFTQQHDLRFYASCYVAGGLSSGIRWVLSPLELVKTRLQMSSSISTTASTTSETTVSAALRSIYTQEGAAGLFRGLGPTAAAYWAQTSTKYGLYEFLKDRYSEAAVTVTGKELHEINKGLVYVSAAATAEFIADVFMCPWEMLRVRVQAGINGFPSDFRSGLREMMQNRSAYSFPFGSLGPLWARQIPGTIVNFYTFENTAHMIYGALEKPKEEYNALQQLGVTFASGYTAGFCAAIISHPADSLISLMALHKNKTAVEIAREVGFYKLATRGLAPRILVTGKIISVQWLLYDTFKSLMGFGTTGG